MLLNFKELTQEFNTNIKGVIHVGGHYGQEYADYEDVGIKNMMFFEPLPHVFAELKNRVPESDTVKLFNIALGNEEGEKQMYVEHANQGQSSSFLKPMLHTQFYPDIVFENKMGVFMKRLDNIGFDRNDFNLLAMDVQGFEMEVLKGAMSTLPYIDYIYCEVNTGELYEGCVKLPEIDEFLEANGFERVKISMTQQMWGDIFAVRTSKMELPEDTTKQEVVPKVLKPVININYPPNNEKIFEQWFDEDFYRNQNQSERIHLPVYFTSYFVNNNINNVGVNPQSIEFLQKYIDSLDRSKKYFTVLQYDDGTLIDFRDLDIMVFNAGGGDINGSKAVSVPIPLISNGKKFEFEECEKDINVSFVGRLTDRPNANNTRKFMVERLEGKSGYFISTNVIGIREYEETIHKSKYILAPRGYGKTSFRIYEALKYGAVPIYISDEFHVPFNEEFDYGLMCHRDALVGLQEMIKNSEQRIEQLRARGREVYKEMFTYKGLSKKIINYLNNGN